MSGYRNRYRILVGSYRIGIEAHGAQHAPSRSAGRRVPSCATGRTGGRGGGGRAVARACRRRCGRSAAGERSFVEAVRALPQVRALTVAGEDLRELEVTPKDAIGSATLRRAIERRLANRRLGEMQAAGRRLPVLLRGPRDLPLGELPIRRGETVLLLAQVGLEDAAGRKVRDFSGGMRRRIGIARALIGEPPIVIVDEPTTGLDIESRQRLRESLLAVAGERIIVFSTHIPGDVAAAMRILLIHQGRLFFDGSAGELVELARGRVFERLIGDGELREFSHRYRVTARVRKLDGIRVRAVTVGGEEPAGELVEPNLEEAYLAMIGDEGGGWGETRHGRSASLLDLERWRSR